MASTTLSLFWNLSSNSVEDRIDASAKLVSVLETFQAQHVPSASSGETSSEDEDEEDGDGGQPRSRKDSLDRSNAPDVAYSIRRLVRGLASPRESSRLGFAVALTELLSRITTVSCSQIISLVTDASRSQGSVSGQEERDALFAQLFGLTSVVQSGLLLRSSSSSTSSAPADLSSFEQWLIELLMVGTKKSWLRESAGWTILLGVSALAQTDVSWRDDARTLLIHQVFVEDKIWTPEKVAILLRCQDEWKGTAWEDAIKGSWKHSNVLHSSNFGTLAKILKESDDVDDGEESNKLSTGSWKPQLHFVWDILLERLLPASGSSSEKKNGSIQDFFRIVVDESLFASSSSAERKYHGFQVFSKALARADQASVPYLFTPNFMRCFINHLASTDRYLHRIARSVAFEIQNIVQKTPALGMALLTQLTGEHGSRQFDRLTKTKTVESILGAMDTEGITKYIHHLLAQVNPTSGEEDAALNARRSWIIDQLSGLVRNGAVPKADGWVAEALDFLALHGLFVVKKKSEKSAFAFVRSPAKPAFTEELRAACCTKLLSSLADLTGSTVVTKTKDGKSTKATGVAADGTLWVSVVLESLEKFESDPKHIKPVAELDEVEGALRAKAKAALANLKTVSDNHKSEAHGAELLLGASLLQRYCAVDEGEADESLQAATDATSRMFSAKVTKKSKKVRQAVEIDPDVDTLPPLDVLIDVIIGFLDESTAYMRTVANQAFAQLGGVIERRETLGLILTQLERRDPAEEEEEPVDMDVDEDEQASDAEHDSSLEGSADEVQEESEEDDDEEEDKELRLKLEQALGKQTSDDDSEEELMDDEQMMAIDEQLAMIFKSRTKDPKTSADAQRKATHFKNRVLDLVDIFLKTRANSPLAIDCILPLVDLITGTGADEKQLADKTSGILRSRFGKAKEVPTGVDKDQTLAVLDEIHSRSKRATNQHMLATLSQCSLYLTRTLLDVAKDAVVATYKKSLEDFSSRKASALSGSFFHEFAKRHPCQAWDLRSDVLELASRSVNAYRKCQVFQVLHVLLSQSSSIDRFDKDFVMFAPSLRDALLATLAPTSEPPLNATQAKDLLKLASQAVRQSKRIESSDLSTMWKSDAWEDLRSQLAASDRFKASTGLLNSCKQIVQMTSGSSTKAVGEGDSLPERGSATKTAKSTKPGKRKAEDSGAKQVEGKSKAKKVKKA